MNIVFPQVSERPFSQIVKGSFINDVTPILRTPPPPTLVSFNLKGETMQNAKTSKKIVRLNFIDALICPKT